MNHRGESTEGCGQKELLGTFFSWSISEIKRVGWYPKDISNFTKVCNGTKIEDALCWTADLDHRGILSLVTNIPLSIVAFLGNALIIAALRTVSCCHPPSKVLLGGLACSDLCIGLITQPLRNIQAMHVLFRAFKSLCSSSWRIHVHVNAICWSIADNSWDKRGQTSCVDDGATI